MHRRSFSRCGFWDSILGDEGREKGEERSTSMLLQINLKPRLIERRVEFAYVELHRRRYLGIQTAVLFFISTRRQTSWTKQRPMHKWKKQESM